MIHKNDDKNNEKNEKKTDEKKLNFFFPNHVMM